MNYSLKYLFKKFRKECLYNSSYTTFCRIRPFWVVPPKLEARDTCLCVQHENIKLITEKLFKPDVINESHPDKFIKHLTCEDRNERCWEIKCLQSVEKLPHYLEFDGAKQCAYQKWTTKKKPEKV